MDIQLIRSATLRLDFGGRRLLIDPCFSARHTRPSYAGISANPMVDLPLDPDGILDGVEGVVISHLHSDHFDPAAEARLPRDLPLLCQPCDAVALRAKGFQDVTPVEGTLRWGGIAITRTACEHGSGSVLDEMGEASGFVFRTENEPVLYWAGDTVWCPAVAQVLAQERPEVAVVHACGATWGEGTLIVMDAAQALEVCRRVPTVVATHLEAYDHGTVTRAGLRARAEAEGIPADRLMIPEDGQTCRFTAHGA